MMAYPTQMIFYFDVWFVFKTFQDNLHFNISNYVKAHIGLPVTQLIGKLEVISKK